MGNNFTTTNATPATGGMTLTTARTITRLFARNAGITTEYSNRDVDTAIQNVGNRFCKVTRALVLSKVFTLVADDASVAIDFTDSDDSVMPEQLIDVFVSDLRCPMRMLEYAEIHHRRVCEPDETGTPCAGAVIANATTANTGAFDLEFFPASDGSRTLTVRVWRNFTVFAEGMSTDDADTTYLNIPDAWLRVLLKDGGPGSLQTNVKEKGYAIAAWQRYLEAEKLYMGAGSLGSKVIVRSRIE